MILNLEEGGDSNVLLLSSDKRLVNTFVANGAFGGHADNGVLRIHRPKLDGDCSGAQISIPGEAFQFDGLDKSLSPWVSFLQTVLGAVQSQIVILIEHDLFLTPIAVLAKKMFGIPFGLLFENAPVRVRTYEYMLYGLASFFYVQDDDLYDVISSAYIGPINRIKSPSNMCAELVSPRKRLVESVNESDPNPVCAKKILIVSHFAGQCRSVSVQRVNYFYELLKEIYGGRVDVHLAASVIDPDLAADSGVHHVLDFGPASLVSDDSIYRDWAINAFQNEKLDALSFSTLGYYWRFCLEDYFERLNERFDIVLISGNPYHVFNFAAFAKRRWNSKVIFDYRDPFAMNPRIQYKEEQRQKAIYAERGYNLMSDLILAVNNKCESLIVDGQQRTTLVVPNGFDERYTPKIQRPVRSSELIRFVHSGSFYYFSKPERLLSCLDPERHAFYHMGGVQNLNDIVWETKAFNYLGRKEYSEVLGEVGMSHCGVLFLSESGFETTTKLFDYLSMGIDVLICYNGELQDVALVEVLDGVTGVYMCKNTIEGIEGFLSKYRPGEVRNYEDSFRFSRRAALDGLVQKMEVMGWI